MIVVVAAAGALIFGTADSAETSRIVVDDSVCRSLVVHEPDPGVEYQPGVDVYGRSVAPADLPGGQRLDLGDEIAIPLIVDLAQRFPDRLAEAGLDLKASLGTLTIAGDEVRFDDAPLDDSLVDAIAALCAGQRDDR